MDSSNAPTVSSTTNKVYFKGSYLCQNWSLPDSIIYYLAKNQSSPKCYQKMIKTCKYFFSQNPIIICSNLWFYSNDESEIKIELDEEKKYIDLKNFTQSFWITDNFSNYGEIDYENLISSFIPNIYQCDVKNLDLWNQDIFFNELLFLASKADEIHFNYCTVIFENGSVVSVEKIIETFDQAKTFEIYFQNNDPSISSKTVENLFKIPHFSSIGSIYFGWIPQVFDIETFYGYMKENKHTLFCLIFDDTVSDAYENRLEEIVDEIIETENHDYKPPYINFARLDDDKRKEISDISSVVI